MAKKIQLIPQYKGGFKDRAGKLYSESEGQSLIKSGSAKMVQWKGKKIAKESYEGGQYTGGREKGVKNLVKLDNGKLKNQHGVVFTQEEKKALERAANTANRRRMAMLKNEKNLPLFEGGKYTGYDVSHRIGPESDFILARKSKSLQRFKSKAEYRNYMKNLKKVNSKNYITNKIRDYKRNHMKALENVFGDDARDIINKIRTMPLDEYMNLVQSDEVMEVSFTYDPQALAGRLNQIRGALGMQLQEQPF